MHRLNSNVFVEVVYTLHLAAFQHVLLWLFGAVKVVCLAVRVGWPSGVNFECPISDLLGLVSYGASLVMCGRNHTEWGSLFN